MKYKDIIKLDDEALKNKVVEINEEIVDKVIAINNNSHTDTSVVKKLKKQVAQIKTLIRERKNNVEK